MSETSSQSLKEPSGLQIEWQEIFTEFEAASP